MDVLYKTTAVSTGGRDGKVSVKNSSIELEMARPSELGGSKKVGANPEQLFAAGYSACFGSAIQHVLRAKKLNIPAPTVQATVGMFKNSVGGYSLTVEIVATLFEVNQEVANDIVREAHIVCPYSNATKGNIEVSIIAKIM